MQNREINAVEEYHLNDILYRGDHYYNGCPRCEPRCPECGRPYGYRKPYKIYPTDPPQYEYHPRIVPC